MKHLILLLLFIFPCIAFSQRNTAYDSSKYYIKQMSKAYKQAMDSLEKTDLFIDYLHFQQRSNNYDAQTFFFNILHSDYGIFNKSIALSGFPALNPVSYGIGFGYAGKFQHGISDFAISLVFPNTSKKEDKTISSALFNILFDMGYDVLRSNNFSLYPYVGLSARISTLSYLSNGSVNPTYTNISDVLVGSYNVNTASFRLGYQLGLGVDVALSHNKDGNHTIILFAKGGVNQPFGKDKFKIENVTYDPQIKKGDWMLSVGLKFTTRRRRLQ